MVKSHCLHASLIPRQLLGLGGEAGGRKESIFTNSANSKQTPWSKSSCSSAVPLLGLCSYTPHILWPSCLTLPVISRAFKGNFNSRPFLPDMRTAEPNLQVRCNFIRQKHSRSTKNAGPAGCGPRAESESAERRVQSGCTVRNRAEQWQDAAQVPDCSTAWVCMPGFPSSFVITAIPTLPLSPWFVC